MANIASAEKQNRKMIKHRARNRAAMAALRTAVKKARTAVDGKAEDAAHSSGDVGVLLLAVRRDTAAVGSDTDGDYSTLNVDASGRLQVLDGPVPAVVRLA